MGGEGTLAGIEHYGSKELMNITNQAGIMNASILSS